MNKKQLKKEVAIIKDQIQENLGKIGFFMESVKGMPFDLYKEYIDNRKELKTLSGQIKFCGDFCSGNKKWCEEHKVLVNYKDIVCNLK